MQASDYVAALRRDASALADTAEGRLEIPVPSCPGWSMEDLVAHTTEAHWFWGRVVKEKLQSPDESQPPGLPSGDALIERFRTGAAELADLLASTDGSTPVWTWAHEKNVSFITRRMAQETAVHGWDGANAAGAETSIESSLAADGVEEFLFVFVPVEDTPPPDAVGSIHLHQTDGDGEWTIELSSDGGEVTRGHSKGAAAVRATASDLLLLLWRRVPPSAEGIEVFGDPALLDRWLGWMDLT
jgi:uncharacterized protein (TIGR03083 family)